MKYNIHAGHCPQGHGASGAVGLLQESVENRIVKDELINVLRKAGNTVYDTTCDISTTASGCLRKIVQKCNLHKVFLDMSLHLNSGRGDFAGDGKSGGCEVYIFPGASEHLRNIAENICANISNDLHIRNRGVKFTKNLYVLRNTNSPAILVECCFVDDKDDAKTWNPIVCAHAIARALDSNCSKNSTPVVGPTHTPTISKNKLTVDGIWGTDTTKAIQKYFGTYIDGIVSNQPYSNMKYMPGVSTRSWMFKHSNLGHGSPMIKKIQKFVGAYVDGFMGVNTIKKMQFFLKNNRYYNGEIDGFMGRNTIRGIQQYLNDH